MSNAETKLPSTASRDVYHPEAHGALLREEDADYKYEEFEGRVMPAWAADRLRGILEKAPNDETRREILGGLVKPIYDLGFLVASETIAVSASPGEEAEARQLSINTAYLMERA